MAKKSNVDSWLERETKHNREALENASRYFDGNDNLTVNTFEAVYGQESSFGVNSKLRPLKKPFFNGHSGTKRYVLNKGFATVSN
jgi:hypothetical protein